MIPNNSSSNVLKAVYARTSTAPSSIATATEIDALAAIKTSRGDCEHHGEQDDSHDNDTASGNKFDLLSSNLNGFRTFRQKHGGRRFGKKNKPKRLRLKAFAETFRMICGAKPVYARSPSSSQRPAPSTIASRSPFPLCLCSCSTSLSRMGT